MAGKQSFRDTQGRVWEVQVHLAAIKRVQAETGLFLPQLLDLASETARRLMQDPVVLFDCLCALLRPQLEQRGVAEEELGAALDEAACEAALEALLEAVIFFSQPPKRTILQRAWTKVREQGRRLEQQQLELAAHRVESPEFDRAVEQALQDFMRSSSGAPSTSSPESSASTPQS